MRKRAGSYKNVTMYIFCPHDLHGRCKSILHIGRESAGRLAGRSDRCGQEYLSGNIERMS